MPGIKNTVLAGGENGTLGIKANSCASWQVGKIQSIWYKAYASDFQTNYAARIIPELQSKPSIISPSYTNEDLIPAGQPLSRFDAKKLKLAHSLDGFTWKILPTSVVDTTNHTVAAVGKVGGYYMIVSGCEGESFSLQQSSTLGVRTVVKKSADITTLVIHEQNSQQELQVKTISQRTSFLQRILVFLRNVLK